jgi:hypothetical protein
VPTFRQRPTALVILALVEVFGFALAVAARGSLTLAGGLRADHAALLLAFAAWPWLAVRAARRPELKPAVLARIRR